MDELSVGNLTFFAGEEFTIVNEFDIGFASLDEARGECCEGLTSGCCPASCSRRNTRVLCSSEEALFVGCREEGWALMLLVMALEVKRMAQVSLARVGHALPDLGPGTVRVLR